MDFITKSQVKMLANRFLFLLLFGLFFLQVACTSDAPPEETPEPVEEVVEPVTTEPVVDVQDTMPIIDTVAVDTTPVPQKEEKPSRKPPKMEFETTSYTYDTIQQGDIVEYAFKFKNVGERPLVIKDVKGSCGCTIGSYPFLDIAPNEENEIKARFDSKGKKGAQFTTITVYSNTKPVVLTLKGIVVEK